MLGHPERGATTTWLSGYDIICLASNMNQDAHATSPNWLAWPMPRNFWRTYFERTLNNPEEHGRLHVAVVNTEDAYEVTASPSGQHWITVAWIVNPHDCGLHRWKRRAPSMAAEELVLVPVSTQ